MVCVGLVFLLLMVRPRPSIATTVAGPSFAATTSIARPTASSSDDVIVVSPTATTTVTTASPSSDDGALLGGDARSKLPSSSSSSDEPEVVSAPPKPSKVIINSAAAGVGDVAVHLHVAQGDENVAYSSPPPPPPRPSRSFLEWMAFLRERKAGGGSQTTSRAVARAIAALETDVRRGYNFANGEMGERLAEIEALERNERDGAQKRVNEMAKARLEERVRQAAEAKGDALSSKIAEVERLMSQEGATHPELLPKLRAMEKKLMGDSAAGTRRARGVQQRLKDDVDLKSDIEEKAAAIEWEIRNRREDAAPRSTGSDSGGARAAATAAPRSRVRQIEQQEEWDNRIHAARTNAAQVARRRQWKARTGHDEEQDDGDDDEPEEVIVVKRPMVVKG
jgi:hypothetical protein